jgi:hypothetical protein
VKREVLVMEAQNCCSGCGIAESTQHIFFECPLFSSVLHGIARWFGVNIVFHNEIKNHFAFCCCDEEKLSVIYMVCWYLNYLEKQESKSISR